MTSPAPFALSRRAAGWLIALTFAGLPLQAVFAQRWAAGSYAMVGQKPYGPLGTDDDSRVFQAALDDAEARGRPLELPTGATVNLRGTVYLGNVTIHGHGATITALLDDRFVQRGTANRRNEGAILTKAAAGAGYGVATVRIAFDSLTLNVVHSTDRPGVRTGLLLENVDGFTGDSLTVLGHGTGRSEVDPLDFFAGVQGVRIGAVREVMNNGGAHGGFWIRNFSPTRPTSDIDIGTVVLEGSTGDELLSIFSSGSAQTDVNHVHIGHLIARPDGGGGMALSIYRNVGDYDPAKMRDIAIDRIDVTVGAINPIGGATGGFVVKVQKTAPRLGPVRIVYDGAWSPLVPAVFGIRFAPGTGQGAPLAIPSVEVVVNARNRVPQRSAAMLYGPISTDRFTVSGSGSGFRQAAYGVRDLHGAAIQRGPFSGEAVFGARSVLGSVDGVVKNQNQ